MILDNLPGIGGLNKKLQGKTDSFLTTVLIMLVIFGFVVALTGPPVLKAAVIAYWIFP